MTCLSATHSTGLWCNANWIQSGRVGYRPLIWISLSRVSGIGTDVSDVLSLSSVYLELCWLQLQSFFKGLKVSFFMSSLKMDCWEIFVWIGAHVDYMVVCCPITHVHQNIQYQSWTIRSCHVTTREKINPNQKKEVDNSEKWNLRKCTYCWSVNYLLCFEMRIELPSRYGILINIITRYD